MAQLLKAIASLTCDRVDLFSRSLNSILNEVNKYGHSLNLAVFDDSRSHDIREKKKNVIRECISRFCIDITFIGIHERVNFSQVLIESLPKEVHSGVKFFLFGDQECSFLKGPGCNRNTALSAFAGKAFLSFDDDTELKISRYSGNYNHSTDTCNKNPFIIGNFSDQSCFENIINPCSEDIFNLFDSALQVSDNDTKTDERKVFAAMAGLRGGRWYSRPFGIMTQDNELRSISYADDKTYKSLKYNPFCFIQSLEVFYSNLTFFIGAGIGLNATSIVPPFFPQIRNEDHLWAIVNKFCYKDSLIVHLPFAIYHDREEKHLFTEADYKKVGVDMGTNITLLFRMLSDEIKSYDSKLPLELFGKALIDISNLPQGKWQELCAGLWNFHVGATVNSLNELLDKYEREPYYWARDVDKYLDRLRSSSLDPEAYIPHELHIAGSPEKAGILHRKILRNYGTLLINWGGIWKSILDINNSGSGLIK